MQELCSSEGWRRFNKLAFQDRIKGGGKRGAGRDGSGAEGVETYGRRNGGEQPDAEDARRARAGEWERMEQKLDAADIRACGGFLPLGRAGRASGTEGAASDVGGDGRTMVKSQTTQSVGEAVPKRSSCHSRKNASTLFNHMMCMCIHSRTLKLSPSY